MTLSPSRRRERNQRATKAKSLWRRVYRSRMKAGLERCRRPRCLRPAQVFAHIVAHANGGRFVVDNLALLCRECDLEQGTASWRWLQSVADDPEYEAKMAEGVLS